MEKYKISTSSQRQIVEVVPADPSVVDLDQFNNNFNFVLKDKPSLEAKRKIWKGGIKFRDSDILNVILFFRISLLFLKIDHD